MPGKLPLTLSSPINFMSKILRQYKEEYYTTLKKTPDPTNTGKEVGEAVTGTQTRTFSYAACGG